MAYNPWNIIDLGLFLKLLETKSTDRKQTLLHFIVDIIHQKYPELRSFYTELHFTDKAAQGTCLSVCLPVCHSVLPSIHLSINRSDCIENCTLYIFSLL